MTDLDIHKMLLAELVANHCPMSEPLRANLIKLGIPGKAFGGIGTAAYPGPARYARVSLRPNRFEFDPLGRPVVIWPAYSTDVTCRPTNSTLPEPLLVDLAAVDPLTLTVLGTHQGSRALNEHLLYGSSRDEPLPFYSSLPTWCRAERGAGVLVLSRNSDDLVSMALSQSAINVEDEAVAQALGRDLMEHLRGLLPRITCKRTG